MMGSGSVAAGLVATGCASAGSSPAATRPITRGGDEGSPGPFASLAGFCDGVTPTSPDELATRRARAAESLSAAGHGAVWMEPGPSMVYFTGVRWSRSERPLLACLTSGGDLGFVSPAFEGRTLEERLEAGGLAGGQLPVTLWDEHVSPYDQAAALARRLGVQDRPAQLERTVRSFIRSGLEAAPVASAWPAVAAGDGIAERTRRIKTSLELARLRRATEATKAALAQVAAAVQPGMSEADVRALVVAAQRAAGLENIWALVLFGANASYPHGTAQRRVLAEDDLVLVDTGGFLHGYASDVTRTWPATTAGRIDDARRRGFDVVLAAQSAALERIVAGSTGAEVDAAARAVVAAAGFGADYETFTHRLGHGIGLEVHEAPYMVRGASLPLQPGMTMSDEPGLYLPGRWGIRIEDIVAVTDGAPEVFGPRAVSLEDPFGAGAST